MLFVYVGIEVFLISDEFMVKDRKDWLFLESVVVRYSDVFGFLSGKELILVFLICINFVLKNEIYVEVFE